MGRLLRPAARLYTWWRAVSLGRHGEVVVLPDALAIFICFCASAFLIPFRIGLYFALLLPALALAPFILTTVVWVSRVEVLVVRFFLVFPYWMHRVPEHATFELDQAWENRAPSGVAFESVAPRRRLHLGTTKSAQALYRHISVLLERAGWRRSPLRISR